MDRIKVIVTADHMRRGGTNCKDCPIALALHEVLDFEYIGVDEDSFEVSGTKCYRFKDLNISPREIKTLSNFIKANDRLKMEYVVEPEEQVKLQQQYKPFQFEMDSPTSKNVTEMREEDG